jgi:hypothetical protein
MTQAELGISRQPRWLARQRTEAARRWLVDSWNAAACGMVGLDGRQISVYVVHLSRSRIGRERAAFLPVMA